MASCMLAIRIENTYLACESMWYNVTGKHVSIREDSPTRPDFLHKITPGIITRKSSFQCLTVLCWF